MLLPFTFIDWTATANRFFLYFRFPTFSKWDWKVFHLGPTAICWGFPPSSIAFRFHLYSNEHHSLKWISSLLKKKETREQASRGFGRSPVTTNQLSGKWQDVGPPSIECHHNRNGKRQRGRLKGGGPLRTTQVRFDWRISVQRSIGTPQKTRSIRAERRASCLISIRPSPVGADQRQSLRNAAAFILLLLLHFLRETFRWRPLSSAAGGIGVDRRWRSNPSIKTESALEKKKRKQEWETFLLPAHWVLIEKYNDEKESSSKNSRPSIHRIATLTLVISDSTRTSRS